MGKIVELTIMVLDKGYKINYSEKKVRPARQGENSELVDAYTYNHVNEAFSEDDIEKALKRFKELAQAD